MAILLRFAASPPEQRYISNAVARALDIQGHMLFPSLQERTHNMHWRSLGMTTLRNQGYHVLFRYTAKHETAHQVGALAEADAKLKFTSIHHDGKRVPHMRAAELHPEPHPWQLDFMRRTARVVNARVPGMHSTSIAYITRLGGGYQYEVI